MQFLIFFLARGEYAIPYFLFIIYFLVSYLKIKSQNKIYIFVDLLFYRTNISQREILILRNHKWMKNKNTDEDPHVVQFSIFLRFCHCWVKAERKREKERKQDSVG